MTNRALAEEEGELLEGIFSILLVHVQVLSHLNLALLELEDGVLNRVLHNEAIDRHGLGLTNTRKEGQDKDRVIRTVPGGYYPPIQ